MSLCDYQGETVIRGPLDSVKLSGLCDDSSSSLKLWPVADGNLFFFERVQRRGGQQRTPSGK